MTEDAHDQAKRLINANLLEEIPQSELAWLEDHLEGCGPCREYSQTTESAIQSFRSISVLARRGLVEVTQHKVRARARAKERAWEDSFGVWVAAAMAAALTAITTPAIGHALDWVGQRVDISGSLLQFAYVWLWLIPSLSAVLLLVCGQEFSGDTRVEFIKRGE